MTEQVSIREYVTQRLDLLEEHRRREQEMLREAVSHAAETLNLRLAGMNELRDQINSERGAYLGVQTFEAKHELLQARIALLEQALAKAQGMVMILGVCWSAATIGLTILLHFWK